MRRNAGENQVEPGGLPGFLFRMEKHLRANMLSKSTLNQEEGQYISHLHDWPSLNRMVPVRSDVGPFGYYAPRSYVILRAIKLNQLGVVLGLVKKRNDVHALILYLVKSNVF